MKKTNPFNLKATVREAERNLIISCITEHPKSDGKHLAKLLGVSQATLNRRMRVYGIDTTSIPDKFDMKEVKQFLSDKGFKIVKA